MMKEKPQHWLQKRPLLAWFLGWSLYFEIMMLLWRGKGPNPIFLGMHLTPVLVSLPFCVRPAIARLLVIPYLLGIVAGVILPLKTNLDPAIGRGIGGACLAAIIVIAFFQAARKA